MRNKISLIVLCERILFFKRVAQSRADGLA
jgi:hypothetical protein